MTTNPEMMVTLGGDTSNAASMEEIGASIQREDTKVEAVERVGPEVINST